MAPTGDAASPADNPNLPITPEAVARDVWASVQAGASIAHLHCRDAAGRGTMDMGLCRELLEAVRERCADSVVLNLTTAGSWEAGEDERCAVVALKPDMCSLDAGSMNFGDHVFTNSPRFLERLARTAQETGVKPECEVFDLGQLYNVLRLAEKGWMDEPLWVQFVLGIAGGAPAEPRHLQHLVSALPAGSRWSVIGIGRHQLPMTTLATIMGGHARVGLEDNLYLQRGVLATNPQMVERTSRLAAELQRPVADVATTREMLALPPR